MAAKFERGDLLSSRLFYEARVLNILTEEDNNTTDYGIPHVYYCGSDNEFNVQVMDLYGKSLKELFIKNGRRFDLKTTLMAGIQMI